MLKLDRLLIENFQTHKLTDLTFDHGFNVIWGESEIGKTAMFRAIRWLVNNEPDGDEFITYDREFSKVTGWFSNQHIVTRERTVDGTVNLYHLTAPGQAKRTFRGFGVQVPGEIKKATGMAKVYFDVDTAESLNFAYQLAAPFFFKERPAVRGKAIGRLNNAHRVDAALKNVLTDSTRSRKREKELKGSVKAKNDSIKRDFVNLDEEVERMERGSELLNAYVEQSALYEGLKGHIIQLNELHRRKAREQQTLDSKSRMVTAFECISEIQALQGKHATVEYLIGDLQTICGKKQAIAEAMDKCRGSEAAEPLLVKLNELLSNHQALNWEIEQLIQVRLVKAKVEQTLAKGQSVQRAATLVARLQDTVTEFNEFQSVLIAHDDLKARRVKGRAYLDDKQRGIADMVSLYQAGIKELGKCPVCFGSVDEHTTERILEELTSG